MRSFARIALVLALALPAAPRGARAASPALTSLVEAERAFSAASVEKGVRQSFLAFLAPDAIVFRPLPVNGPASMRLRADTRTPTLAWEPAYAEVSAAGDLGVTTGPWEQRPMPFAPPSAFGQFISVWKKQPSGKWKVAVDIGTSHARPERGVGSGDLAYGPTGVSAAKGAAPADLRALDRELSNAMRTAGRSGAYATRAAPDVRFNRDDSFPVVGIDAARAWLNHVPGYVSYRPAGRRLAASGDLGCTWGRAEEFARVGAAADSSVYLHVWRRDAAGAWKLSLEVLNPLPKPGR